MLNRIELIGTLVRDPEAGMSKTGVTWCRLTLAVDRPKKQGQAKAETDFINCVAFGKLAELIGNGRFEKRSKMFISDGRLQIDNYTDKNGEKRSGASVVINKIEFIDSKVNNNASPMESMGSFEEDIQF